MLVSMAAVLVIMLAAIGFSRGVRDLSDTLRESFDVPDAFLLPVLKCVAIAITSRIVSDLCKDSAQSAAATSVEFAGTVCALSVIMPLITSVLRLMGGLI